MMRMCWSWTRSLTRAPLWARPTPMWCSREW
jgi:hypothetical protein